MTKQNTLSQNKPIHPAWFAFLPDKSPSHIDIVDSLAHLQQRLDSVGDFMSSVDEAVSQDSIRAHGMMLIGFATELKSLIDICPISKKLEKEEHVVLPESKLELIEALRYEKIKRQDMDERMFQTGMRLDQISVLANVGIEKADNETTIDRLMGTILEVTKAAREYTDIPSKGGAA
jgi:hypothetical protein